MFPNNTTTYQNEEKISTYYVNNNAPQRSYIRPKLFLKNEIMTKGDRN